MTDYPIDTNVVLRFLVENPETVASKFRGVFDFFEKLEQASRKAFLPDLVLFQAFFVLTSYYKVPSRLAAEKLLRLVEFRGIRMTDKPVAAACLRKIVSGQRDLVDAWLVAWCESRQCDGIFSFDTGFKQRGLKAIPIA